MLSDNYGDREFEWQKEYGPVYRIKGCLGVTLKRSRLRLIRFNGGNGYSKIDSLFPTL